MAFTVTATQGGSTAPGIFMRVWVLTHTAAIQNGATWIQSLISASAHEATASTTVTGSRVYGAVCNGAAGSTWTPAASTTIVDTQNDATNSEFYGTCKTTSVTGTPGSVQVGTSAPANGGGGFAGLEILPSGTITEDVSGPSPVTTTGAGPLSTASFNPPPGSLIVVAIASDGGAGVTTFGVAGGGLTFTAKAEAHVTGADYAGVWIAFVPLGAPVILRDRQPQAVPPRIRSRIIAPPFVPPVVSPVAARRLAAIRLITLRRPAQQVRTGMLPSTIAVSTPIVTVILRDRQAPAVPPRVRSRVMAGMLPGSGQMYPQPQHPALRVPSKLVRAPAQKLRSGTVLPPLAGAGHVIRQRIPALARRGASRVVPGTFLVQVAGRILAGARRLVRAPAQRLRSGMLPGTGLSGLPPASMLRKRQAPAVPLRARSRLTAGMLPGTGLSGIPPAPLRARQPRLVTAQRSRITAGTMITAASQPVMAEQAVIRAQRVRPVRAPAQRLRTGLVVVIPLAPRVIRPAVMRTPVLRPASRPRLIRGFIPPAAPPTPVTSRRVMSRPPKAPRVVPQRLRSPFGIFASPAPPPPPVPGPPLTAQFTAANPVAALVNATLKAGAVPSPAMGAALADATPGAGVVQEQDSAGFERGGPDSA